MATKTVTTEVKLSAAEVREALTNWLREKNHQVGSDMSFTVMIGDYPSVEASPNTFAAKIVWTNPD